MSCFPLADSSAVLYFYSFRNCIRMITQKRLNDKSPEDYHNYEINDRYSTRRYKCIKPLIGHLRNIMLIVGNRKKMLRKKRTRERALYCDLKPMKLLFIRQEDMTFTCTSAYHLVALPSDGHDVGCRNSR